MAREKVQHIWVSPSCSDIVLNLYILTPRPWPQSLELCGPRLRDSSRARGEASPHRGSPRSQCEHSPLPLPVRRPPLPIPHSTTLTVCSASEEVHQGSRVDRALPR